RIASLVARSDEVFEGLGPRLALGEVMRQLLIVVGEPIGVKLLDRLRDRAMEVAPALHEQALIGDVLDDRVLENVGRLRQEPKLVHDLQRLELAEETVKLVREPRA